MNHSVSIHSVGELAIRIAKKNRSNWTPFSTMLDLVPCYSPVAMLLYFSAGGTIPKTFLFSWEDLFAAYVLSDECESHSVWGSTKSGKTQELLGVCHDEV